MLSIQILSAGDLEPVPSDSAPAAPVPTPISAEDAALLEAVSEAASEAATKIVVRGLIGFGAISVSSMATRKLGLGFLQGVLLISGVSFVASKALK